MENTLRSVTFSTPRNQTICFNEKYSGLHNVAKKPSTSAKDLINPIPPSYFKERLNEKLEEKIYASKKRAPLGHSYNQQERLPSSVNFRETLFGLPSIYNGNAGILINPPKSLKDVYNESQIGQELYKKSHNVYDIGETCNRGYNWSQIPNIFGKETPHDNSGLNVKKSLKWFNQALSEKSAKIVSKQLDSFRERSTPKVGTVHDPLKDTLSVDKDHVFGISVPPDEICARDLIYMRNTENSSIQKNNIFAIITYIRNQMKKVNYQNFEQLEKTFCYEDKDQTGKIDAKKIEEICLMSGLPIDTKLLKTFLKSFRSKDKMIDYVQFIHFINWREELTNDIEKMYENKSDVEEPLENKKEPIRIENESTKDTKVYGIPTIRRDLPPPILRRIGDVRNYGDQYDLYGLITPSNYSKRGIEPFDLSRKRSSYEIKKIFSSIGVEMTEEVFQELWEKAQKYSTDGQVSIELFKTVLHQRSVEEILSKAELLKVHDFQAKINSALVNKPIFYQRFSHST